MSNLDFSAKKYNETRSLSWGDQATDLFLNFTGRGDLFEVLDYEYDHNRIHSMCGGRVEWISSTSLSGKGHINNLSTLIPVGYYRVDDIGDQCRLTVAPEVTVMVPYLPHTEGKYGWGELLDKYPVVVLNKGCQEVIFCNFRHQLPAVLKALLTEKELPFDKGFKKIEKTFVKWGGYRYRDSREERKFLNIFGYSRINPWNFAFVQEDWIISEFIMTPPEEEKVHEILGITQVKGQIIATQKIAGRLFGRELLEEDPTERINPEFFSHKGWEVAKSDISVDNVCGTNIVYKMNTDKVFILAWKNASEVYKKKYTRLAEFIPETERDEFIKFMEENLPSHKYVEYEMEVPKILFFLEKDQQIEDIERSLRAKISRDIFDLADLFVKKYNDKQILETLPDDLIVTVEDSWSAGNCKPGTEAFVSQYFPGKTEATIGELKKFAENWNVMRLLRYIALREGVVKLELPTND